MELKEKKQVSCVTINVFVKCDKCDKKEDYDHCHHAKTDKNENSCVDINVFVECDEEKK